MIVPFDPIRYTKISWYRMNSRCHNPKDPDYWRYGGQGIAVCPEWRASFEIFFADMGLRPYGMTLDRKDSTLGYTKDNCRWATSKVQNRHSQTLLTYKGVTKSLGEWAAEYGLKQTTLTMRLKRMSLQEALTTPVQK